MTQRGFVTNEEYVELSECMLYGNGRNRWFDKVRKLLLHAAPAEDVDFFLDT
mgnify:CR=1 FL=1